ISRHHLVEIKCVKELPLSTLSLPHHGLLPRIAVSVRRNHGSPTVSTRVLQHNQGKADMARPPPPYRPVANDPIYGPAVRCKKISPSWWMCGLASMYPAFDWSLLCSGPSWISARVRSH